MLKSRKREGNVSFESYVTVEQFLSQEGLRQGIYDVYQGNRFKQFKDLNYGIAYERGRQIGVCAQSEKIKIRHLYDGFTDGRGAPTEKLLRVYYTMTHKRWFV